MEKQQDWWIHQPQEQDGDYWFNGQFLVTKGVKELLSEEDIFFIYMEIQGLVQDYKGLDYFQVFIHETTGQKLFFIDQLSKAQIDSGEFKTEYNHCTLMLAEEY